MNIENIISNALGEIFSVPGSHGYTFKVANEDFSQATFHIQHNVDEQLVTLFGLLDGGTDIQRVRKPALLRLLQEAAEPMRAGFGIGLIPESDNLALYCIISANLFDEQRLTSTLPQMYEHLLETEKFLSASI